MWADVDTRHDFLNFSEVADLVVDVVSTPSMRPVSVGVFGTWGTGKSTLLNLIEDGLKRGAREDEYIVVRFDAWLYQGFDDARASLMEVIATTLIDASQRDKGLLDKARSLLERVNKMRMLGLVAEVGAFAAGVPTMGWLSKGVAAISDLVSGDGDTESVEAVRDAGAKVKERGKELLKPAEKKTPPKEIAAFQEEFGDVMRGLKKTLVVFVDNLDRCLPPQTIHTLEALRLFLFMDHTAFIVAADEDMVRHAVSRYFADPGDRHVTDYLDKLIQVPVRVPAIGVHEIRAYLFLLFASADAGVTTAKLEALRARLEDNLRNAWAEEPISTEDALDILGPTSPELARAFGISDRMASMLVESDHVRGNPRIVKRMLNVVRMRAKIAQRRSMPVDEALIAKMALFERCANSDATAYLYREINASPDGKPEILATLVQYLDDEEGFDGACPKEWRARASFVREWLDLEPPLDGINLRPLVYLSRETTPLRSVAGRLSEAAAEGLRMLLSARKVASKSAIAAAGSIPEVERVAVMKRLIDSLRAHGDWLISPAGIHGAIILADSSAEAAEELSAFIRRAIPGGMPPWLAAHVREKKWFLTGEVG